MGYANFQITGSNGATLAVEGSYYVHDNGVLAVKPDSGSPFIMSPSGWVQITVVDAPEKWNLATGASDEQRFGSRK